MTSPRETATKAWTYLLAALRRPGQLPRTIAALAAGVNLGQYLKLNWPWIRRSGIRTVIDVGAHQGEFSSAIRALLPDARIYAFEPLPDCCKILSQRLGSNGHGQTFPVAIGRRAGNVTIWRCGYPKSSSVLLMTELHKTSFPWTAENTPLTVEMNSLDGFDGQLRLAARVLLKIDVQGYEAEVLRGAKNLLEKIDFVLLEISFRQLYEGQASFKEIYDLLKNAGFSYSGNLEQLLSPLDGSVLQADAFFVRRAS